MIWGEGVHFHSYTGADTKMGEALFRLDTPASWALI
jgi:hypothetical protein